MPRPSRADLTLDDAVCKTGDAIEHLLAAVRRIEASVIDLQAVDHAHCHLRSLREEFGRPRAAA